MSRIPVLLTTGVLAAAVGAGALGVAAAAKPTASPTGSSAASTPTKPAKHPAKGLVRRVAHGEFVVRQKGGFATIVLQRGTITAVNATAITLKSVDGYTGSYAITANTKIRSQGKPETVAELKLGEVAMIRGVKLGATATASRIAGVREGVKKDTAPAGTRPAPQGSTAS
jgi:hypothetical protein